MTLRATPRSGRKPARSTAKAASPAKEISAGLLVYRRRPNIEVLLAHPGGPFWAKKDIGVWSIPKGVVEDDNDLLAAARREFTEETGFVAHGPFQPLAPVALTNGKRKIVYAFACEGDFDPAKATSNTFEMEWPPRSGRRQSFPEVDRVAWFDLATAREKILPYQKPLLDELEKLLRAEA